MPVEVKLPTILRRHTGGEATVSGEGSTVRQIFEELDARYPGIARNVVAEDGGLRRFVNVYVEGEDIRFLDGLETPVEDGDEVTILPAVAGGA